MVIKYKIRDSDWLTFPLIIVNFNHFYTTGPSSCCFTTPIKLYKFRSCSASVFPHTTIVTISSTMLPYWDTFQGSKNSMLENILTHYQPKWHS